MTSSKYITIPLTRGYSAIVNKSDSDLSTLKWYSHISSNGRVYARRTVYSNGKKHYEWLHKVVYCRANDLLTPPKIIDHIDNNSLNNKRKNLRAVSHSQNLQNSKKQNRVMFKGAKYHKRDKRWRSSIRVNGKSIWLGSFNTAKEAHKAYCEAAKKYFGEFARFA